MRALAALYVLLHHAAQGAGYTSALLGRGREAVTAFLTISGFCLALPMARKNHWQVDAVVFFKRRAWRILPPYFCAVALGIVVILICNSAPFRQHYAVPLRAFDIASHFLLIQNWFETYAFTIDGPLWSVALECQLYLLFPAILMLRRRYGAVTMLVTVFLIAHLGYFGLHHHGQLNYLFTFCVGIWGAELAFQSRAKRWLPVGATLSVAAWLLMEHAPVVVLDLFTGIATSFLLAYLTQHHRALLNRALSYKPLAWIGLFSYSIYLVHNLVQVRVGVWLSVRHPDLLADPAKATLFLIFIAGPPTLAISYLFHRWIELPFLNKKRRMAEQRLDPVRS